MIRLLALLLLVAAVPAAAQTFPELTGRVVDQADLLTPDQEYQLTERLAALEQASTRQLVVVTVDSLEDYPIEDYGYRLGRRWGVGQSEANNGIILLVAPNERDQTVMQHAPTMLAHVGWTADAATLRERLTGVEAAGATEILYGPMGPDIERELKAFIALAG